MDFKNLVSQKVIFVYTDCLNKKRFVHRNHVLVYKIRLQFEFSVVSSSIITSQFSLKFNIFVFMLIAGDRVVIYMPLIPEVMMAMLATVRIGAVHSVVFGGKSIFFLAPHSNRNPSLCKI